ncbi:MAG: hypothetical protein QW209_06495 [Nitrososphaerota archaeon]
MQGLTEGLIPSPPPEIERLIQTYFEKSERMSKEDIRKISSWIIANIPEERIPEFLKQYSTSSYYKYKALLNHINGMKDSLKEIKSEAEERFVSTIKQKVIGEQGKTKEPPSKIGQIAESIYTVASELFPDLYAMALEYGYEDSTEGFRSFINDIVQFWIRYKDEVKNLEDYKALVNVLVKAANPSFMLMVCDSLLHNFYMECIKLRASGTNIPREIVEQYRAMLKEDLLNLLNYVLGHNSGGYVSGRGKSSKA